MYKYVLAVAVVCVSLSAEAKSPKKEKAAPKKAPLAGKLYCEFDSGVVDGYLSGTTFDVNQVIWNAGEDLNENPAPVEVLKSGLIAISMSTASQAGDAGRDFTVTLPADAKIGKFEASLDMIEYDMAGGNPQPEETGTCTLQ